jgi:uncharacterized protein
MNNLGVLYQNGLGVRRDVQEALRLYREAANLGEARAMINLAAANENVPSPEYGEALIWLRKAAEMGERDAMFGIGVYYERGLGVQRNYGEALNWYRRAAALGQTIAMNNIAVLYQNGNGVEQNPLEAMKWLAEAARLGDRGAQADLTRTIGLAVLEGLMSDSGPSETDAERQRRESKAISGPVCYAQMAPCH